MNLGAAATSGPTLPTRSLSTRVSIVAYLVALHKPLDRREELRFGQYQHAVYRAAQDGVDDTSRQDSKTQ
ncbi:hypothetical protein P186_1518 [Pyrobaculum ferrireducens]|uniref:Uncharacterized protein n=1 Tax=Pyrobaculum ferrireducens TaxID=1104324 RepID=G7VFD1_9CREN|nr:hypothetical protein P186_1518 [Pyrobaculum ferrireducens]